MRPRKTAARQRVRARGDKEGSGVQRPKGRDTAGHRAPSSLSEGTDSRSFPRRTTGGRAPHSSKKGSKEYFVNRVPWREPQLPDRPEIRIVVIYKKIARMDFEIRESMFKGVDVEPHVLIGREIIKGLKKLRRMAMEEAVENEDR